MRNPFNWAGNKYKYMKNINAIIGKEYDAVYDVFMGSGNIIANLYCSANLFVGNDIIPLMPNLYNAIIAENKIFSTNDIEPILNQWNRFNHKSHYYDFRDYWNVKYLSSQYDREFIYETILLLKMCSNSMVRFNRKEGYFNQGFRGLGGVEKEFFTKTVINNIVNQLNVFKQKLDNKHFNFHNKDFKDILSTTIEQDLIILDPPYILSEGMYGEDFTEHDDLHILNFLTTTKSDFILFNYLESGDKINTALKDFLDENDDLYVEIISEVNATRQSKDNSKKVCEVMISNIKVVN